MNEMDQFDWLDDTEKAELKEMMNAKTQQIVDNAIKRAEKEFEGLDLDNNQENIDLFNEYVRQYAQAESDAFIKEVNRLALEPFKNNEATQQIREFFPNIESFGFSNTKIENHLAKPETNLNEILNMEGEKKGFNADVASDTDRKKGYSYPVTAEFTLVDDTILSDNFNYSSSVRLLVSAIGNAYDYAELETRAAGTKSIRVDHLINIMDGKPTTTRVRAKRVKEVTDQIKILRTISVKIDAKAHQEYNSSRPKEKQLEQNTFTGYLLPVEIIERKEFSKDKQVYINILKRPVLYEYAREAKQVITVKSETLDLTTYPAGKEPDIDKIKYMTRQISSIRDLILLETRGRGRNLPYTAITYDYIYKHVEDDLGKKPRKQTVRTNVDKVVAALIAKGVIKKKEIKSKGKTRYGTLRLYKY